MLIKATILNTGYIFMKHYVPNCVAFKYVTLDAPNEDSDGNPILDRLFNTSLFIDRSMRQSMNKDTLTLILIDTY